MGVTSVDNENIPKLVVMDAQFCGYTENTELSTLCERIRRYMNCIPIKLLLKEEKREQAHLQSWG